MASSFDLGGSRALVTGCRRGIGRATCLALARAGADIAGISANLEPDGGEIGAAVRDMGRRFDALPCDLADRSATDEALAELQRDGARVDILINNAGTIRRSPAAEHSDADWDAVMAVNLDAQFRLARAIGKSMVARGGGKIVFVASVLGFQGGITVPGYAASKGAVIQLTRALANEWAPNGVNVNAVAPGYVATDNTANLRDDPDRAAALLERIPAGRWATPEDIAAPIVFLASPAADYVHGATLAVDGGWLSR